MKCFENGGGGGGLTTQNEWHLEAKPWWGSREWSPLKLLGLSGLSAYMYVAIYFALNIINTLLVLNQHFFKNQQGANAIGFVQQ